VALLLLLLLLRWRLLLSPALVANIVGIDDDDDDADINGDADDDDGDDDDDDDADKGAGSKAPEVGSSNSPRRPLSTSSPPFQTPSLRPICLLRWYSLCTSAAVPRQLRYALRLCLPSKRAVLIRNSFSVYHNNNVRLGESATTGSLLLFVEAFLCGIPNQAVDTLVQKPKHRCHIVRFLSATGRAPPWSISWCVDSPVAESICESIRRLWCCCCSHAAHATTYSAHSEPSAFNISGREKRNRRCRAHCSRERSSDITINRRAALQCERLLLSPNQHQHNALIGATRESVCVCECGGVSKEEAHRNSATTGTGLFIALQTACAHCHLHTHTLSLYLPSRRCTVTFNPSFGRSTTDTCGTTARQQSIRDHRQSPASLHQSLAETSTTHAHARRCFRSHTSLWLHHSDRKSAIDRCKQRDLLVGCKLLSNAVARAC
jgi:hypothetical protein